MTLKATVSAKEMVEALKQKFPPNEFAMFSEVRSAAGVATFDARSADAVAVGLLPSRGMQFHGFEIKIDRWDWQRELTEKGKADVIGDHCDYWWLVTAGSIARPEELPVGWGLLVVENGKVKQVVAAKVRANPKAITRELFVSLVRCARTDAEKSATSVAAKIMLEERRRARQP
jgi:hypothetical protein